MSEIPEQPKTAGRESIEYPARVLLIDDYESITRSLKAYFRGEGDFDTATCHDAAEAIAVIEEKKPEIVLLDHALTRDPEAGFKVARWILQQRPNTRIFSTTSAWLDVQKDYERIAFEAKATHPITHVDKKDFRGIGNIIGS